eukprot:scaffold249806_cov49-Prasinocladus_malaysianus.AAC.1
MALDRLSKTRQLLKRHLVQQSSSVRVTSKRKNAIAEIGHAASFMQSACRFQKIPNEENSWEDSLCPLPNDGLLCVIMMTLAKGRVSLGDAPRESRWWVEQVHGQWGVKVDTLVSKDGEPRGRKRHGALQLLLWDGRDCDDLLPFR